MQARGSSTQNQQNQNPNVGVATTSGTANDVKANLDTVLEISLDKRNVKPGNRGGKRKRINPIGGSLQDGPANVATSSLQ